MIYALRSIVTWLLQIPSLVDIQSNFPTHLRDITTYSYSNLLTHVNVTYSIHYEIENLVFSQYVPDSRAIVEFSKQFLQTLLLATVSYKVVKTSVSIWLCYGRNSDTKQRLRSIMRKCEPSCHIYSDSAFDEIHHNNWHMDTLCTCIRSPSSQQALYPWNLNGYNIPCVHIGCHTDSENFLL